MKFTLLSSILKETFPFFLEAFGILPTKIQKNQKNEIEG